LNAPLPFDYISFIAVPLQANIHNDISYLDENLKIDTLHKMDIHFRQSAGNQGIESIQIFSGQK
jgi:hypothetical protein